jgi:Zn finger protein HypA/HybF involved in hydrogenase expression
MSIVLESEDHTPKCRLCERRDDRAKWDDELECFVCPSCEKYAANIRDDLHLYDHDDSSSMKRRGS